MTSIIELAEKCGATIELHPTEFNPIFIDFHITQLQAFVNAIRKDQIERDAKICEGLEELAWANAEDSWQYGECAEAIRNQLRKHNE